MAKVGEYQTIKIGPVVVELKRLRYVDARKWLRRLNLLKLEEDKRQAGAAAEQAEKFPGPVDGTEDDVGLALFVEESEEFDKAVCDAFEQMFREQEARLPGDTGANDAGAIEAVYAERMELVAAVIALNQMIAGDDEKK